MGHFAEKFWRKRKMPIFSDKREKKKMKKSREIYNGERKKQL